MQQPKRFQAGTLSEAYDKVRRELGADAVILSTRKAYAPGLFGQPGRQFVEVVAHLPTVAEAAPAGRRPVLDQDLAAHDMIRAVAEATAAAPLKESKPTAVTHTGFLRAAAAADRSEESEPETARQSLPTAELAPLSRQLDQMRTLLESLVADRAGARMDAAPAAARDLRDRLIRHGISPRLAATILGEAGEAVVRADNVEAMARTVERKIAAKLPQTSTPTFGRRPLAIFLVGPGGAGKTTVAVRLGLELERANGLRVALAGTDVNRAGAPQQLLAYGAATGLPVHLCYGPEELDELLRSGGADVVIVDTPGHNGLKRDRMAELGAFLGVARTRSVLLTLPATMKGSDLADVVAAFSTVGVDGLVATRCDETSHFGALVDVAVDAAIGFAYTTHSDQVSESPRTADNLALATAVVAAEWAAPAPVNAASATRRLARVG
jgi:flagellar biosynthesis protein FlhF